MQRRMDAGFRLLAPQIRVVNFAAHRTHLHQTSSGELGFRSPPAGMWPVHQYVSLLMGEIPRLTDDPGGYGPAGKQFIAHVDVPEPVTRAHRDLLSAGYLSRTVQVHDQRPMVGDPSTRGTDLHDPAQ
ncbi:hypothetical protein GCM10009828_101570 [Actinoplanes couchii]|uniref:Uncharacterized protein n=2 Tax=Actinoplanes couchii TaxID=403638 RepID=A0ABQ3XLP5_9ACTN|nr:hypothetical protein Aco03nite_078320 [Actinoplanes couchii]